MSIDLSSAILATITGEILVSRQTGVYVDGSWTPADPPADPIPMAAGVQQLRGRDVDQLPEGYRTQEAIRLYTLEELSVGSRDLGQQPDSVILRGGVRYQVLSAHNWADYGYWESLATKEEV